ncbi:lipocalin-like domain-containing protein [Thiohalorhabdus sp. Cl-TMA]|uniref:Lipocalin-like domain-containing protein n=1 Tax=Thiohalorhabdus methylotrophus TaxID=3242694 RepID=A0ABV4TSG8_9GAMM
MRRSRREFLRLLAAGPPLLLAGGGRAAERSYARVTPERPVNLPADHAAHPDYAIEWWYFTGFLDLAGGGRRTFEVTFFRNRPEPGRWLENPSAFTPRQVMSAHAALGDPTTESFRHWRRLARVGLDGGRADPDRLRVGIRDWALEAETGGSWRLRLNGEPGAWDLALSPTGKAVLQGRDGISAKNASGSVASYYYSYPALAVRGTLPVDGRPREVTGTAWFDHEWTSTFLPEGTAGWDWVGLRFAGGGGLMAYRFRDPKGRTTYAAGTWIRPDRTTEHLGPDRVRWRPLREWTSPETGSTYPVAWEIRAGGRTLRVTPLFDSQEMRGTGPFNPTYWEGAMRVGGDRVGEGFLEMTRF